MVVLIALKTLFSILSCVMAVALVYGIVADNFSSCFNLHDRWTQVALTDFAIYYSFITAWYFYKESRWIMRVVLMLLQFWLGRDIMGYSRGLSVVATRVIIVVLGCLMVGVATIVFIMDGSPVHAEILSPCMRVVLVDLSVHAVVFSVWIAYKESSWIITFFWILLLVCFGSITMCAYLARELFYLSSQQHVSLILFNKSNRDLMLRDPLLIEHSNV